MSDTPHPAEMAIKEREKTPIGIDRRM